MLYFHFCQTYIATNPERDLEIRRILQEYSSRDNLKGVGKISTFTSGIYVLKITNPFAELILQEKKIKVNDSELTVYFVRRIKNGLQDYIEIRDGKWLNYNELPEDEIEKFRIDFLPVSINSDFKVSPPKELIDWQNEYSLKVEYDVYETSDWVKFAASNSNMNGMKSDEVKLYKLTLEEILKQNRSISVSHEKGVNFETFYLIFNNIAIFFTEILLANRTIFLLHDGANISTQQEHWKKLLSQNYSEAKNYETLKDVSSLAIKAYPKWALKDADLWSKIEKNNEMGNLSLLPEQTEFLKEFKFPKYINGQAGSGKSTMLYYLFANVYYYKYAGYIPGEIIFLTENERLLKHTKDAVFELLLYNPEFDLSSEDVAIVNVEKHFYPFKKFLLNLLPTDVDNFKPEKYLDFSKFKLLYENSNIPIYTKNKFSPELVWFTLSTYVYGHDLNFQITSLNYEEQMPREGKELLSREDLNSMEKDIINPFYNKLLDDEEYWDKIKLIKYLNDNITIDQCYDVIFCDEAQDFSRVELEFIMKLSTYTRYNLRNVEQFPIVFAGDALQTVNPTGFRSEVLTAMIYNELKNIGFDLTKGQLEFTPTYNYRSTQAIVNVANAIQNFRKLEFNVTIKSPQTSKRPVVYKNEHLNVFVDFDTFYQDADLQRKVTYKTIIVPVNTEEIEKYKQEYPILINFDNILSAVDAKGLDFNEVVIFGFGEYLEKNQLKSYEKQFFYNKLYVAVTRAQSELVIIDSKTSQEEFWKKIIKKYLDSEWSKIVKDTPKSFEEIIIFDSKAIIQSSNTIREVDAFRQKERGKIESNISLLNVASSHFIKLGNTKEYYLCLAIIEEIKGNWKKAAEFYLKKEVGLEGIEKAIDAYWSGKFWSNILKIGSNLVNPRQQIRIVISKLFTHEEITSNDLEILYNHSDDVRKLLRKTNWRSEALDQLGKYLMLVDDDDDVNLISDIIDEVCTNTDRDIYILLGEKFFSLKKYRRSIDSFEKVSIENESYIKSKLELAYKQDNYHEIIVWLARLAIEIKDDFNEIASKIIKVYLENELANKPVANIYFNLYVYFSFLVEQPSNKYSLELAKTVEELFTGREMELGSNYYKILESDIIDRSLYNFVLERWVKNHFDAGVLLDDINFSYQELSELITLEFEPFTNEEVKEILKIPRVIIQPLTEHLVNFKIKNFRRFEEIEIKNLGLVNIVVGDNNVGKTSFLEALLFTSSKEEYLKRLAYASIERINIAPEKEKTSLETKLYYNLDKSLFLEYLNKKSSKNIKFKVADKRNYWEYEIVFGTEHTDIVEKSGLIRYNENDFKFLKDFPFEEASKQPYIPFGKGYGEDLSKIYDSEIRSDREREREFLKHLRFFIPSVEQVFVSSANSIDIRDSNFAVDQPLHQYGEGANKLFRILVLLTLHKGKRVLIDEIDAGIHFSRFKEFWRIILKIAYFDNTQIIATTHNEECIRYFNEVLAEDNFKTEYQKRCRVVQMKLVKDQIKIRSFDYCSFNLAFEDGIELRGDN